MLKNNFKTTSGFTLSETLLALAIFVIAILVIVQLYPAGLAMSRLSKNETIATNLVQAKLEEMKATPYSNINNEARAHVSTNPSSPYYQFERQTMVEYVDSDLQTSATNLGLKKIIVTVYWPEKNQEKSVSATYLKHN